jgi:ABC-type branched-subunit amino acid transport system substrate-binding protein
MKRHARLIRLVAAIAVAVAITVPVATGASDVGARQTATKLVIGDNTPRSGANAGAYLYSEGFQGYLDLVNKSGGVNGYTFEVDTRDNVYNAAQSALAQNQLLAKNPFAISVIGTLPVVSAAEVSKNQGSTVPLMVAADGALVQSLSKSLPGGGIFGVVPNYSYLGPYDAQFIMNKLKDKRFALAWENSALAQGAQTAINRYVRRNGGSLRASIPVEPTTTDFVPLATRLKASGAKTVLVWTNLSALASLQKAADQIGFKPTWVTPFFSQNSAYLRLAGTLAEGTYINGIWPTRGPAVAKFVKKMQSFAPRAINSSGMGGWMLAALLVEGIRGSTAGGGKLTHERFVGALRRLNKTVELAQLDYRTRNWGLNRAAMYQVRKNRFVQVQGFSKLPGL